VSILDRILLVILALWGLFSATLGFLSAVGVWGAGQGGPLSSVTLFPNNIYSIVLALVMALIGLRFLFYRVGGAAKLDAVVMPGEHGTIRISFETLKQLANRTGKSVRGVQDFDTRVRTGQNGVQLAARVRALPDIDLAQMSTQIQLEVKAYVEKTSGVNVESVTVNVVEISSNPVKTQRTWVE